MQSTTVMRAFEKISPREICYTILKAKSQFLFNSMLHLPLVEMLECSPACQQHIRSQEQWRQSFLGASTGRWIYPKCSWLAVDP